MAFLASLLQQVQGERSSPPTGPEHQRGQATATVRGSLLCGPPEPAADVLVALLLSIIPPQPQGCRLGLRLESPRVVLALLPRDLFGFLQPEWDSWAAGVPPSARV